MNEASLITTGKCTRMIVALITLYKPSESVLDNIKTILPQVDRIYLCDNSPDDNKERFSISEKITYKAFCKNLALSGAFNYALKDVTFGWNDNDYVLFFDQDSYIKPNHVKNLVGQYELLITKGINVGCIGPLYYNINAGDVKIPKMKEDIDKNNFLVKSIITSSMLVQYGKIKSIGFWNEKIFLDMADWDLCWRFQVNGMKCVETRKTILEHSLGVGAKKIGTVNMRIAAPIREYYQTRNYIYLLHEKYTPSKYRVRFIFNLTIRPIIHWILLENKRERMHYVARGYRDAHRNIYGEYTADAHYKR